MKRRFLALVCVLGLLLGGAAAQGSGEENLAETAVDVTAEGAPEETVDEAIEAAPEEAVPEEDPEEAASEEDPEEAAPEESAEGPPVPDPASEGYLDVPEGEWYADSVAQVTGKGLMTGIGEGLFAPLAPVTRAAVVTVLWRMEGSPAAEGESPFRDVTAENPETAWFLPQTIWAKAAGIASGYEDDTFRGSDPVKREELAAFLYRYDVYRGQPLAEGVLALFGDADQVSDWARAAMSHATGMGLFRGDESHNLNPLGTATRAELAAILLRMLAPSVG